MNALPAPSHAREVKHADREVSATFEAWYRTPLASAESHAAHRAYLYALIRREDVVAGKIQEVKEEVMT